MVAKMRQACLHAAVLCLLVVSVYSKSLDIDAPTHRSLRHIHVSIHLFSGRPNPTWRIPETHKDYLHHVDMMRTLPSKPLPNRLGYQGFTLKHVQDGTLGASGMFDTTVTSYPEWELSLLESIDIDNGMKAHVRNEIKIREHTRRRRSYESLNNLLRYNPDEARLLYKKPTTKDPFIEMSPDEIDRIAKIMGIKNIFGRNNVTTPAPLGPTKFEPEKWNHFPVLETNNCYNYANNEITYSIAQPGHKHGCSFPSRDPTGREIMKASECDGLKQLTTSDRYKLPDHSQNLVALVFWPPDEYGLYDFHWYRLDVNKFWSHKPGKTNATNVDNNGRTITDPRHAARGYYTEFVSFMQTSPDKVTID